ncbi:MAG TPA: hypothetical protein VFL03_12260 [Candidatus Limnocylindrales bacterium]|nr:hypothetical protein [Candidatus Limnocylindrales bacterium]
MFTPLPADRRIERPGYAWIAVGLQLFTAVGAIPVGLAMLTDTTGRSVGLPGGWIEATPFGSYLVPGLYLLLMNGVGMLLAAGLVVARHRWAPWLTAILGVGLVIWIAVQVVVLPETSLLQLVFGATGLALTAIGVAWLRRTGQLATA